MDDDVLSAKYVLEYAYTRSLGSVLARFFDGLREGRIEGIRRANGGVLVPPAEYDPETSDLLTEFVEVGQSGTVTTWAWQPEPRPTNPVKHPFAWALVRLDGAETALLHAVDVQSIDEMTTGMRVRVKWAENRTGSMSDIECFVPVKS